MDVHAPTAEVPDARGTWAWVEPDEKGRVAVRLNPGRYRIDVLRDGTVVASAEASLEEGKATALDVEVPRP